MPLTVGSRLGHYHVIALISEGGMGQAYQATDTRLNRQMALKLLPQAFADDPDRLPRGSIPVEKPLPITRGDQLRGESRSTSSAEALCPN